MPSALRFLDISWKPMEHLRTSPEKMLCSTELYCPSSLAPEEGGGSTLTEP